MASNNARNSALACLGLPARNLATLEGLYCLAQGPWGIHPTLGGGKGGADPARSPNQPFSSLHGKMEPESSHLLLLG